MGKGRGRGRGTTALEQIQDRTVRLPKGEENLYSLIKKDPVGIPESYGQQRSFSSSATLGITQQ